MGTLGVADELVAITGASSGIGATLRRFWRGHRK